MQYCYYGRDNVPEHVAISLGNRKDVHAGNSRGVKWAEEPVRFALYNCRLCFILIRIWMYETVGEVPRVLLLF